MFCATSCVLGICLTCQNKWEKMTFSLAYERQNQDEIEVLVLMHVILWFEGEG